MYNPIYVYIRKYILSYDEFLKKIFHILNELCTKSNIMFKSLISVKIDDLYISLEIKLLDLPIFKLPLT
jgi:hypothetical protein